MHRRGGSVIKPKTGKSAHMAKRSLLNPNNLFFRQQPLEEPDFIKDPTNKFMKKPFIENLPLHQKTFYSNKKGFISLFEDVTKINLVFSEIISTVLCYRPKLAQTLSNLNLSYNKLYERLLDQNHKAELDKEKEVKERIDEIVNELQKSEFQKAELTKKIQYYENVKMAKESELKAAQLQEEELRLEILNLKVLNQEMQQFKEPIKEKKEDNPEDDVADSEKIFDKMGKEIGESQLAISALENEQNAKKEILMNMDRLLKQVLQHSKQDQ